MLGQSGYSGWILNGSGGGGGGGTGVSQINFNQDDFEADGVTVLNPLFTDDNINLFFVSLANYITKNVEWQYVAGGIKILIVNFDANEQTVSFIASLKTITTS